MKRACVYQCLQTRKLSDQQPLIDHFNYLVEPGHQLPDGKSHEFYAFGFETLTAEGVRQEISQYVDEIRGLKKQKKIAKNVNDIAFTDMISLPRGSSEEMLNELAASLYMLDPTVPCCFVLHEQSNKGVSHPHFHMIRFKRTKDGIQRMNEQVRLKMMELTRRTITETYLRHGYTLKEPADRQFKHVNASRSAIRNFARRDAILTGESDIKAGISFRMTDPIFLLKIATNQLEGQTVEAQYVRAVAREEAELQRLKILQRKSGRNEQEIFSPDARRRYVRAVEQKRTVSTPILPEQIIAPNIEPTVVPLQQVSPPPPVTQSIPESSKRSIATLTAKRPTTVSMPLTNEQLRQTQELLKSSTRTKTGVRRK